MRSYSYSEGKWALCKDTLPATVPSTTSNYRATDAQQRAWTAYHDALVQAGFPVDGGSTYTCRFGTLTVYGRNHATLTQQRRQAEGYDFVCLLRFGGTTVRVWIDALPNLFLFFTDVDARPVDETLKDFLEDDTFRKLLGNISALADHLYEGYGRITVEVEPKEK